MTRLGKLMRSFARQTTGPLHTPSGKPKPVANEHGTVQYAPELDGEPDPGEVVGTRVARGIGDHG